MRYPLDMAAVLYRCATTGQTVQVWFADDVPDDTVYISLRCPACARMHLVNRSGSPHAVPALTVSSPNRGFAWDLTAGDR